MRDREGSTQIGALEPPGYADLRSRARSGQSDPSRITWDAAPVVVLTSTGATRRPLGRGANVPRISVLRRAPGQLVMIAGLLGEALPVAAHLAGPTGILRIGGGLESRSAGRIDDRRGAVLEKADAEEAGLPVFLAWGLGPGDPVHVAADTRVRQIAPDRLWVVVDPARKHDDTKAWVTALARHRPVDAYLPLAGPHTASPGTLGLLGLRRGEPGPVG